MTLRSVLHRRGGPAGLLCAFMVLACGDVSDLGPGPSPTVGDGCGPCVLPTGPPEPDPGEPSGGPCVTSVDCAGGLVCGYEPTEGCDARGQCVAQVAGPSGVPACGCDGSEVQYVAPGFTIVPVASPSPCAGDSGATDAGESEGGDAGGTDAEDAQAADSEANDAEVNDGEANDGEPGDGDVNEKG
jgi:hypothetical protein